MLFAELHEALSTLENPSASARYQEKLNANSHPDTAARETSQEIDSLARDLRNKLEALRDTARDLVNSSNSELQMVTPLKNPTQSPESTGSEHISDLHSSQVGGQSTPPPSTTPTKIKQSRILLQEVYPQRDSPASTPKTSPTITG